MMKKAIAIFGAALVATTGALALTGCGGNDNQEKTVMNVSLNPEVEFVLDANDVVISANALNEEGNLIISAGVFEGKSADAAVDLFIEISAETGFLVSGNASVGDNEIEISFSGDREKAEKLFKDVKTKALSKLEEFGVQAKIELDEAISQEDLRELVEQCAPYLEAAEVRAMEYAELVEIIYESRKETVSLYSQELKHAYYEAKAHAMDKIQLDVLKSKLDAVQSAIVEQVYKVYADAVAELEAKRYELLVSEESDYQKALVEFRAAKAEFLKYRAEVAAMKKNQVTEDILATLENYKKVVEAKELLLEQYGEAAHATIDNLKASVKAAYDAFISTLEELSIKIGHHFDDISKKQQEMEGKFFDKFKGEHGKNIDHAKESWDAMREDMKKPGDKHGK